MRHQHTSRLRSFRESASRLTVLSGAARRPARSGPCRTRATKSARPPAPCAPPSTPRRRPCPPGRKSPRWRRRGERESSRRMPSCSNPLPLIPRPVRTSQVPARCNLTSARYLPDLFELTAELDRQNTAGKSSLERRRMVESADPICDFPEALDSKALQHCSGGSRNGCCSPFHHFPLADTRRGRVACSPCRSSWGLARGGARGGTIADLERSNTALQVENASYREATGQLAGQISALQTAVDAARRRRRRSIPTPAARWTSCRRS